MVLAFSRRLPLTFSFTTSPYYRQSSSFQTQQHVSTLNLPNNQLVSCKLVVNTINGSNSCYNNNSRYRRRLGNYRSYYRDIIMPVTTRSRTKKDDDDDCNGNNKLPNVALSLTTSSNSNYDLENTINGVTILPKNSRHRRHPKGRAAIPDLSRFAFQPKKTTMTTTSNQMMMIPLHHHQQQGISSSSSDDLQQKSVNSSILITRMKKEDDDDDDHANVKETDDKSSSLSMPLDVVPLTPSPSKKKTTRSNKKRNNNKSNNNDMKKSQTTQLDSDLNDNHNNKASKDSQQHPSTPPPPPSPSSSSPRRSTSSSSKRRRRPKILPGSLPPPDPRWETTYSLVVELRSDRSAPVDYDGGHTLPEKRYGDVVYRFQILVALMLSSQTKDAVVGETMKALQKHGLNVDNIHRTSSTKLNELIRKVGFHNNKTKYIKSTCEMILNDFNGDIPSTADELMTLPGVGPKMAYIIESVAFGRTSGIGVDTHMHRIFNQLQWVSPSTATTPERTRMELEGWLPKDKWAEVNVLWVGLGQEVQQQKEKLLRKALYCSRPMEALGLLKRLGMDYVKEGKKWGMEERVRLVMNGDVDGGSGGSGGSGGGVTKGE